MKVAVICVVKNAEFRIAEWIAYQIAVGFDSVILLDNASTDRTAEGIINFSSKYDVRILSWPMTGEAYQRTGYEYALWRFRREFDWCACIDADEFLLPPPKSDVKGMLKNFPDHVAGIGVPWSMFGSSGLEKRPDDLVIESYLYRAEDKFIPNRHIKSILRPDSVSTCINPHSFNVHGDYMTLAGKPMQCHFETPETIPYSNGKLNHYFVQSKQCWDAKLARGYHDVTRNTEQFEYFDRNEVLDEGALRYAPAVRAILSEVQRS